MKTTDAVLELTMKFADGIRNESECCSQTNIEVGKDSLIPILSFLKNEAGFEVLMDLTGVDYIKPIAGTQVVYWLHNPENFDRIRILLLLNERIRFHL